jgi:hypothetical protein
MKKQEQHRARIPNISKDHLIKVEEPTTDISPAVETESKRRTTGEGEREREGERA